jgi:hypothetical protein
MMYIKINSEGFIAEKASKKYVKIDNLVVVNPKNEHYLAAGFLPVVNEDEEPEVREGYKAVAKYRADAERGEAVKYYEYEPLPVVEEPTVEEEQPEGEEE